MSQEKLLEERRQGFLVGMSIAELMLLIIFALLLFMAEAYLSAEKDKEVAQGFGEDSRRWIAENPDLAEDWIQLRPVELENDPFLLEAFEKLSADNKEMLKKIAELEAELESQKEQSGNEVAELNQDLETQKEQIEDLTDLVAREQAKQGLKPLCTYERTAEVGGRRSLPVGIVLLEDSGITLLDKGFDDKEVIDYYFEAAETNAAMNGLKEWSVGGKISWDQFSRYAQSLNDIGDSYATEQRQSCRYYFSYWSLQLENSNLERFNRLNYSQVRISEEDYAVFETELQLLDSQEAETNN